ncbi:MAG: hypothetical protein Q8Q62_14805 [Mesorhizobium sp.]|nr:hypothetical protein [Mesorhizobium sp.]
MSNVVSFIPLHGGRIYRPEFVLFDGRQRRQWAVVEREADGTEAIIPVYRGRKREAFAMVRIWTRAEAARRRDLERLARDPVGRSALAMTPDQRAFMIKMLTAVQQMTGYTS